MRCTRGTRPSVRFDLRSRRCARLHRGALPHRCVGPRRLLGRLRYSTAGYLLALGWRMLKTRSLAPLREWRAVRVIARSGLFDREWYLRNNLDVAAIGVDPVRHYVAFGAREGRDPSCSFNTRGYLTHNPDVAASGANPLIHFVLHGARKAARTGPTARPHSPSRGPPRVRYFVEWFGVQFFGTIFQLMPEMRLVASFRADFLYLSSTIYSPMLKLIRTTPRHKLRLTRHQ